MSSDAASGAVASSTGASCVTSTSSAAESSAAAAHLHDTYHAHHYTRPPSSRPKVDLHTHILPEHLPDLAQRYGYGSWVSLQHEAGGASCCARMYKGGQFFREVESNCFRPEARIKDMDEQKVNVQVLSTVPVMFSYQAKPEDALDLHKYLNDHIAGVCRQYPTRFIGLGTIPMQSPELAIAELRRCMEIGMAGIQIGSHINDTMLGDEKLFPIFEEAARLGASVFIHPWDMTGESLMRKYWLPWLVGMPMETCMAMCSLMFSGVFEKLPNLRLCFAHGGGSFPGTIGRIEHGFRCRPDLVAVDCATPPRDWLGHFWLDSLVHDATALQTIVDLVGANRVALGTDYPFPLGEIQAGTLVEDMDLEETRGHAAGQSSVAKSPLAPHQRAEWDEKRKRDILFRNVLEFLGRAHEEEKYLIDWDAQSTTTVTTTTTNDVEDALVALKLAATAPAPIEQAEA